MSYLGVDAGGTSTRALIVEADGRCIGYGTAGSGNPTASGAEHAASAILSACGAALSQAGRTWGDITGAVAAIAGSGGTPGRDLRAELSRAGVPLAVALQPDILATFCSGTVAADGYVVVVGTGAIAGRISESRIEATRDGLGWLLGDVGSGFWIGRRVIRAVSSALDHRLPMTLLVDMVLAELGEDGGTDRLRRLVIAAYRLRPVELARFARLAFDAAAAGDSTAAQIVAGAVDGLVLTSRSVVAPGVDGPIVLGGSVMSQQPSMADVVVDALRTAGVGGPVSIVNDGVVGAAVLALRHAGVVVDDDVLTRIGTLLQQMR